MLASRGADGQSVRIPSDASRDVQASVQDIKDALRALEAKNKAIKTALEELEQKTQDEGASKPESDNFTEVNEEVVFNSPVTGIDGVEIESAGPVTDGYVLTADGSGGAAWEAAVTDHGALTGLGDDDHTQYLLEDGTRDVSGHLLPSGDGLQNLGEDNSSWGNIFQKGDYYEDGLNVGKVVGTGIGCGVYTTVDRTVAHNTSTAMTWNTELFDNGGFWVVGSPTRLTVPTGMGGWYFVTVTLRYDIVAAAAGRNIVQIYKNSYSLADSGESISAELYSYSSTYFGVMLAGFINLDAADYIELSLFQNSGYTKTARKEECRMTILRMGPKQ